MSLLRQLLPCLLGLGALVAGAADPAPAPLDSLVKNSPFGTAATAGIAGGESGQLEFRGMMVDQGEVYFSFYEPSTRKSQWVGLKETGNPFVVQSYDAAAQSVKVQYHNQALVLTLKRSQIIVQAQPAVNLLPGAAPPGPAVSAPASGDEATRLAQIAEEIRRRRALRSQGLGQPPVPQPGGQGGPVPQPAPASSTPSPITPSK